MICGFVGIRPRAHNPEKPVCFINATKIRTGRQTTWLFSMRALNRSVMLEGRTFRMPIGIPGGDLETVDNFCLFN